IASANAIRAALTLLPNDVTHHRSAGPRVVPHRDTIPHGGDGELPQRCSLHVQHFTGRGIFDFLTLVINRESLSDGESGRSARVNGDAVAADVGHARIQVQLTSARAAVELPH